MYAWSAQPQRDFSRTKFCDVEINAYEGGTEDDTEGKKRETTHEGTFRLLTTGSLLFEGRLIICFFFLHRYPPRVPPVPGFQHSSARDACRCHLGPLVLRRPVCGGGNVNCRSKVSRCCPPLASRRQYSH